MTKKNKEESIEEEKEEILTKRQKQFLEALELSLGIVTSAAKKTRIHRDNHYIWLKTNPTYKKAVEKIQESVLDFTESALFKRIKDGDTASIIFHLKCKGKARGYIEKVQNENVVYETQKPFSWFDE